MRRELACAAVLSACGGTAPARAPRNVDAPLLMRAQRSAILVKHELFTVELPSLEPCRDEHCEAKLIVRALGGYHVNAEYPTKFVAAPGTTVSGSFSIYDATTGVMTVAYTPAALDVTGTLKLALCTDEVCEIESADISFATR